MQSDNSRYVVKFFIYTVPSMFIVIFPIVPTASQQWKFEAVDGLPGVYTIANAQPDNHGETVYVSANVPAKGSKLILYYQKISPGGVIDSTQLWRIIPRTGGSANSQIQNFYSDPNDPGTAYVIDLPYGDTSKPLQLYNLKSSDTDNQQFFYARI